MNRKPHLCTRPVAAVAVMVDNIDLSMETLRAKGFTLITEGDLNDQE